MCYTHIRPVITTVFLIRERDHHEGWIILSGFTRSALHSFSKIQQSMQYKAHSPVKPGKPFLLSLNASFVVVGFFCCCCCCFFVLSVIESHRVEHLSFTLFISTQMLSLGEPMYGSNSYYPETSQFRVKQSKQHSYQHEPVSLLHCLHTTRI